MTSITPYQLRQFQLDHYSRRLVESKTTEERAWLRGELYRLKQKR